MLVMGPAVLEDGILVSQEEPVVGCKIRIGEGADPGDFPSAVCS